MTILSLHHICPTVATVLTVYGIETYFSSSNNSSNSLLVATVLTVYGIETYTNEMFMMNNIIRLQQYLPFTVLKPNNDSSICSSMTSVATVLTVYGIETCGQG